MTLNESKKQQQQQPQPVSPLQGKDFESNLLTELEISAYDLAALQRHLTDKNLVPASVDEDTINKAVYEFRRSYDYGCPRGLFPANKRLEKLFEAWSDACVAAWMRDHGERYVRARYELEHQRETTKYNAVRALIAHLAARRQTEADN